MTGAPRSEEELDACQSEPRAATVDALSRTSGDIIVLGAGGKMGPTLVRMAAIALSRTARPAGRRIIAVSRFSDGGVERTLRDAGATTVRCDLLDRRAVAGLPDAENVVFMAGQKFGTSDAPSRTWMMNVVVPAICAERFAGARTVAFSTGNVYPFVPVAAGGARESDPTAPVGEYAASCVGRERVFEYAATHGMPVAVVRLNYAIDLRYGVLTDLATAVAAGEPVSLSMGHVNVIWQRDANRIALELLPLADSPPLMMNVTGEAVLSVRALATELGRRLGREPSFTGSESPDALLSDTTRMRTRLGAPEMALDQMLDWVVQWIQQGGRLLRKPTHFGARDGAF